VQGESERCRYPLKAQMLTRFSDLHFDRPLYSTFIAPFAEPDALRGVYLEEEWRTPQCYNVNTPPASSKISMFSDETLFYAFYAFPRDLLQMEVSAEL
jgi:CCR4-NOT transcription complex subunit 2